MKAYTFDIKVHYRTDQIWAESEEEARTIANEELQYCGEEYDTTMELVSVEEEGES